jgi:hypothetical protein
MGTRTLTKKVVQTEHQNADNNYPPSMKGCRETTFCERKLHWKVYHGEVAQNKKTKT